MRTGTSPDDAIKAATAGYVKPLKIDPLKVLPAPPEAADAGAAGADASVTAAAGGKPAAPAVLPLKPFDASVDGDRPQVQTSSTFNAGGDPFPGLSPDGTTKVVTFAFHGKEGDVLDTPVRTTDAWTVVTLKLRKEATRDEFDKSRSTLEEDLLAPEARRGPVALRQAPARSGQGRHQDRRGLRRRRRGSTAARAASPTTRTNY